MAGGFSRALSGASSGMAFGPWGAAAGGVIGLGASLIGGGMAGNARNKQMGLYDNQIADLTAWRDTEVNRDFFDSPAGRDYMTRALLQARGDSKTLASSAAVTGESAESQIAKQGNIQSALAGAMSKTAAAGDLQSQQYEMSYQNMLMGLMGQKAGMYAGQAETGGNIVGSAGNFVSGLAPMFADQGTQGIDFNKMQSVPYTGQDWRRA